MKLSTRARYGSRALIELAMVYPRKTVTAGEVAHRQRISVKYLEQIMSTLKSAGLIHSVRGMRGGYALNRPPEEITLLEVIDILDGSTAPVACVDAPDSCPMNPVCPTWETWVEVKEAIDRVLSSTTLRDLVERTNTKRSFANRMYHI